MNLTELERARILKNSQGKIFYGMHFYPGVAQYDPPNEESFRVFINEDTIRQMNPSFAARPVFVEHVDEVDEDVNELRNEADGWVIESFFNQADGKTWAKFIIVSDRGLAAIRRGYRLSNAYVPELRETKATWNGVDYQKVVTGGEFEHLAIVQNPRYEESVIMTPDEFKMYNEKLTGELKRLANSKEKKENSKMGLPKLNIFRRQKLENEKSVDLEGLIVELPKSKKEISLTKLVNDHDAFLNMNGYANGDHMVKVNEKDEMSVNDLVKAYQAKCAENDDGGEPKRGDGDSPELDNAEDEDESMDNEDDESMDNDNQDHSSETDVGDRGGDESLDNEDEEKEDPPKKKENKKMNSASVKLKNKAKAKALADAPRTVRNSEETLRVDLAMDQVERGKSRYGSN